MTSPGGGEPRTIDVPLGNPASSAVYTLPPGITFDVEAVYVEVSTAGAGDTIAELTLSEQSGVVIARKSQSQVIDAGSTGSATWALRLSDDGAGESAGVSAREILSFLAPSVAAGNNTSAVFTKVAGGQPDLFDLSVNTLPACLAAGTYTFIIFAQGSGTWNNGGYFTSQWQITDTTPQGYFLLDFAGPFGANVFVPGRAFSACNPMLVGDTFQLDFSNQDTAGFHSIGGSVFIVRTGG